MRRVPHPLSRTRSLSLSHARARPPCVPRSRTVVRNVCTEGKRPRNPFTSLPVRPGLWRPFGRGAFPRTCPPPAAAAAVQSYEPAGRGRRWCPANRAMFRRSDRVLQSRLSFLRTTFIVYRQSPPRCGPRHLATHTQLGIHFSFKSVTNIAL